MKRRLRQILPAVVAMLLGVVLAPRAEAADYTSTGSGNWNVATTWGGGGFPNGGTDNAIVSAGHTVTVAQASTAYTVSNLTVNGTLTHMTNNGTGDPHYKIDLTVLGDLTVNGAIDANYKGYGYTNGPAPGKGGNVGGTTYGAAHGGLGGIETAGTTVSPYTTYGSITNPTTLGSGGGRGLGVGASGTSAGGGAVILRVSGQTTLNGTIAADGQVGGNYATGGAGGSINLTTATLIGSGTNSANGGNVGTGNARPAGGGGRIAVKLTSGTTFGSVTNRAWGGTVGVDRYHGAAGTVYQQTATQTDGGDVIVDAGGILTDVSVTTQFSTNVTERLVPNLTLRNSGKMAIQTNHAFGVTSNFLNNAQTVSLGGTFLIGGAGTSTIGGSIITNRFYNFTCTNAGKRIVFPSGSSNVLTGVLTLQGAAGNLLQLASSGAGQWKLNVPSPFAGSVSYVDVTNSDARAGAAIVAYDSIDRGGNLNWVFATAGPVTNLWTGTSSTDWGTAGNWGAGRLPVATDIIRITTANSPPNWPILNDHAVLRTLSIETGARLSLGGKNLTVQTNLVMAGTLVATGSETVTLPGNANWTGGAFSNASSTVVINGAGAQELAFDGIAFNNLRAQNASALTVTGAFSAVSFTNAGGALTFPSAIAAGSFVNTGGALAFSNTLTASSFSSTSGSLTFGSNVTATSFSAIAGGVTLTFKDGAIVAVTNLTLGGTSASPMVLVSSAPGTKWKLNVAGASVVSRVTVSDSDASGGRTIRPVASTEGTASSTINWDFGVGAWKVWTGSSTAFMASGNWSPAGIPDATSRLYIESTNGISAPLLTNAVSVAELAIGGGAASLTVQAPLTVTNQVVILPNGVLTHTINDSVALYSVDLTVGGDLLIAAGGAIDASAKGYSALNGPSPASGTSYGASHGGLGGGSVSSYPTYGSIANPTQPGSGGVGGTLANPQGGGVILLSVGGDSLVDGLITANAGSGGNLAAAPSGGSVNLRLTTIRGSGSITANGGEPSLGLNDTYGGGGGRIAVRLSAGTSFDNVSMLARGGGIANPESLRGAAGTIYKQAGDQPEGGDVIIDAGGVTTPASVLTQISTNVPERLVKNLTIQNSGKMAIQTNHAFGVTGNYINNAQTNSLGGTFVVGGTGTTTISGTMATNRFYNFTCTNGGKRIVFPSGSSNVLTGVLTLQGAAGNLLQLASAGAGPWRLTVPSPWAGSVSYVDVTNSDARAGATIAAFDSTDRGGNLNWVFASTGPVTNLWTGTSSTDWGTVGNWGAGRLPVGTDIIRITTANSPPNWPILNDHAVLWTVLVESGARLSLGGKNLTVQTNLVMAGTLVASGTETVTLPGDANWTGGTFSNAASTVVINGAGAQALAFGGIAFNSLRAQNAAAALTLTGSFSAVSFTNTGGALTIPSAIAAGSFVNQGGNLTFGAGFTIRDFTSLRPGTTNSFKDGAIVAVTNLTLGGSAASPMVLVSSTPGTKWKLNVVGASYVSAVTVSDSDASLGRTIRPVASAEGTPGSTINWDFGSGTWKVWTGGSTLFMAATNWNPAGVPDATSRLYIPTTNGIAAPLLTNTLTIGELAIGGGTAELALQAPLTVTNRVVILPSGVLTHATNDNTALYWMDLTVGGDLEIAEGGAISADGKGYSATNGPGAGAAESLGGTYGGMGGSFDSSSNSALTYGSITNPTSLGSGGGQYNLGVSMKNVAGGGALILKVSGTTVLYGRISAEGVFSANHVSGGAGGSVNLTTATLSGSGTISAKGGDGVNDGNNRSAGGGGRVAVKLTAGESFGGASVLASGGACVYYGQPGRGAPGTVYKQTASQAAGGGDLVVDAGGLTTGDAVVTLISTNVTGRAGNVTLRNSAKFVIGPSASLEVTGSWTYDASSAFTAQTNSTVAFVGTHAGTLWGSNTFHNLFIGDPGTKPLTFEVGKTQTVRGNLSINGAALGSTTPTAWWYLTLMTNGTQTVIRQVAVRDSNAGGGQTIDVGSGGNDLGHNVNWNFFGGGTIMMFR